MCKICAVLLICELYLIEMVVSTIDDDDEGVVFRF